MNALLSLLFIALPIQFRPIAPGVEYQLVSWGTVQAHVVRINPNKAQLALALRSKSGGETRTAAQWANEQRLVVAINAGMFDQDYRSNVGYLVDGNHVNRAKFNQYSSVLVFGPKSGNLPQAQLVDLDAPQARELIAQYRSAVQNLRLIKSPGVNMWKKNGRAWSEAAVAQDKQGRLLFIFTRQGVEMVQWNELLLGSGLNVVRAMHMEGGPEASLSIHAKDVQLDLCGSYETGFKDNDLNNQQWPIPNILGVVAVP